MKKALFTLLLITGIATTVVFAQHLTATSNGTTHTQTLAGTTINGIEASGCYDIIVTQGSTSSAVIEIPERFKNELDIKINNGILTLGFKPNGIINARGNEKFIAKVTCPTLEHIKLSGATNLKINSPFACKNFSLSMSGSSDLESAHPITINAKKAYFSLSGASDLKAPFTINGAAEVVLSGSCDFKSNLTITEHLAANISGATDVEITGKSASLKLEASGSSDFKAHNFETKIANISTSGASNATIKVIDQITARTSGSSNVTYYGNPSQTSCSSTGSSEIERQ